ncbi:unnamed protein product [Gongylonema pulchrum]|uniref:ShTK domain protein n=1 Tax=Gongylonema pulchrum TaxID=637853 RepID=A0A183E6Z5_9BILA|nr:unnamed protein product [Gongylonema pulchrum]
MVEQCPKTCNFCDEAQRKISQGCVDKTGPNGRSNCQQVRYLCNDTLYYRLMTEQCPKTCNRC